METTKDEMNYMNVRGACFDEVAAAYLTEKYWTHGIHTQHIPTQTVMVRNHYMMDWRLGGQGPGVRRELQAWRGGQQMLGTVRRYRVRVL